MSSTTHAVKKSKVSSINHILKERFGYTEFRPDQQEVIEVILAKEDVVAILATSSGKSLCYQLPALMLDGITIVVSPLIALMRDQIRVLNERGISAAAIYSALSEEEYAKQWQAIRDGAKLLYVSPERLATKGFYEDLGATKVSLLVIDEAHCASMWGHDFRRDYLYLSEARKKLGNPPVAAFTATAPVLTREDMIKVLGLSNVRVIIGQVERENLKLKIKRFDYHSDKLHELILELKNAQKQKQRTVVYCQRTYTVDDLVKMLGEEHGITALGYHGKMDPVARSKAEQDFSSNRSAIMLATKAFGMGIDIPDIRQIIHFDLPESLEEYWQEVGRAGRDGKPSRCLLFYHRQDAVRLQSTINNEHPNAEYILQIWNRLTLWVKLTNAESYPARRKFYQPSFVSSACGEHEYLQTRVQSALTSLQEYGLITLAGGEVTFHITPNAARANFPVSKGEVETRKNAALGRLQLMQHYVWTAEDNPMQLILAHFIHNTVADEYRLYEAPAYSWYELPDETIKAVLFELSEEDCESSTLSARLRGKKSAAKSKKKGVNAEQKMLLPKHSLAELRIDLEQMEVRGLIRSVEVRTQKYFTLGKAGIEYLKEVGRKIQLPTSYEELKLRLVNPLVKNILRSAIEDWWRIVRGDHQPDRWWNVIREFLTEIFTIQGTKVSGLQLTADYLHTRPIMTFEAGIGRTGKPKKEGVQLKDAKQLLNYLFDDQIRT